jgi:uncharacterized membrane protein YbhN (UPF0104 family)
MLNIAFRLVVSFALLLGVAIAIVVRQGADAILSSFSGVSPSALLLAGAALLVSALLGAVRVKFIADDLGYALSWRDAFAALGLGQVGGALFFSVAGQLIARGAYLSARGQPVSATILMVGYERVLAALVSLALAAWGAWYVFGRVGLDLEAGGAGFLELVSGVTLAVLAGAWLGWGREFLAWLREVGRPAIVRRILVNLALSIAIQLGMMAAYVVIARSLAPGVPVEKLAAASAVVMLAASLPISFGGWGIREFSAVLVLTAVGMSPAAAMTTALLIGIGSLVVVAVLAVAALGRGVDFTVGSATAPRIDYAPIVSAVVPVATATLVFFNVHIPTETGGLNVNLADPLALLGGGLFVLFAIRQRQWPEWCVSGMNVHAAVATAALFGSLLIGAWRFGWTEWALVNKFAGWFILLAYAATGAMIGQSERGLELVLLTFVASGLAVVALSTPGIVWGVGFSGFAENPNAFGSVVELSGFAENRNAFAFQLLMVAAVACVLPSRKVAVGALTFAAVGLIGAGSRAGWGAGICLLATALYKRTISFREVAGALFLAAMVVVLLRHLGPEMGIALIPQESSLSEHIESLEGGLDLFREHPLFGAGLGGFMEKHVAETGRPLVIHSTPVWLLAELGLVGLLAFAVPALRIFRQEIKRAPSDATAMLLVLILVAFGVMSLVHELLYQRSLWLLLGACLAHKTVRQDKMEHRGAC